MLVRIATSTAVMVQQVRGTHYVPVPSVYMNSNSDTCAKLWRGNQAACAVLKHPLCSLNAQRTPHCAHTYAYICTVNTIRCAYAGAYVQLPKLPEPVRYICVHPTELCLHTANGAVWQCYNARAEESPKKGLCCNGGS
jgi:hypothetical protein